MTDLTERVAKAADWFDDPTNPHWAGHYWHELSDGTPVATVDRAGLTGDGLVVLLLELLENDMQISKETAFPFDRVSKVGELFFVRDTISTAVCAHADTLEEAVMLAYLQMEGEK